MRGHAVITIFEHPTLAVTACLAAGLNRRWGWPIVATAGVAAVLPDLDGLAILGGMEAFDRLHRVVGHNLLAACLLGAVWSAVDYRWRVVPRLAARFLRNPSATLDHRPFQRTTLCVWIAVGMTASLSHLVGDFFVSSHKLYGIWELQLLWPFSSHSWASPAVRWGDPVPTAILALGLFAMVRWRDRVQSTAIATLAIVGVYFVFCGTAGF